METSTDHHIFLPQSSSFNLAVSRATAASHHKVDRLRKEAGGRREGSIDDGRFLQAARKNPLPVGDPTRRSEASASTNACGFPAAADVEAQPTSLHDATFTLTAVVALPVQLLLASSALPVPDALAFAAILHTRLSVIHFAFECNRHHLLPLGVRLAVQAAERSHSPIFQSACCYCTEGDLRLIELLSGSISEAQGQQEEHLRVSAPFCVEQELGLLLLPL
ncbi:hypothetical protein BHM03_00016448 [Ensete ventricosum]|nr:hypothetical protein BHM03_00016448 [Ensete ventricosum]